MDDDLALIDGALAAPSLTAAEREAFTAMRRRLGEGVALRPEQREMAEQALVRAPRSKPAAAPPCSPPTPKPPRRPRRSAAQGGLRPNQWRSF